MDTVNVDRIIKSNPVLTHAKQLELVENWQDKSCRKSLDKLVLSNMRIISREAHSMKKKNSHLSSEDLIQEGVAGILKAADMFDSTHDVNFLTYAMLWVKANMKSHALNYRSVVRMGTTRDDRVLFSNLSKTLRDAEESGYLGEAKIEHVAKKLNVNKSSVRKMMTSIKGYDTRLDAPVKSDDGSETLKVDLLEDQSENTDFIEMTGMSDKKKILTRIVDSLPEKESEIIKSRYLSDEPKTLRDLEKEMAISREWVRKLEMRGLDRLKKRLASEYKILDILDI